MALLLALVCLLSPSLPLTSWQRMSRIAVHFKSLILHDLTDHDMRSGLAPLLGARHMKTEDKVKK